MFDAWLEITARLSLSVAVGAVIGLNRDMHHKPAGVRTHALVCLGTALAVIVIAPPGTDMTHRYDALSRVIQGVVTGVGFLGAGVILHDSATGHVTGLTTAAAIWFAAILGLACGAGSYVPVLAAMALGLIVMLGGGKFERWFRRPPPRDEQGSNGPMP